METGSATKVVADKLGVFRFGKSLQKLENSKKEVLPASMPIATNVPSQPSSSQLTTAENLTLSTNDAKKIESSKKNSKLELAAGWIQIITTTGSRIYHHEASGAFSLSPVIDEDQLKIVLRDIH